MPDEPQQQCIFCGIASGQIPSKRVFEDERAIAVLDINPASLGHVLLMPKAHHSVLPQVPQDDIAHLGMLSKHISQAMVRAFRQENVSGTSVLVANGPAAGQRAMHFMMHIIPRTRGDGVGLLLPQGRLRPEDQAKIHSILSKAVAQAFGVPAPEENVAVRPKSAPAQQEARPIERLAAQESEADDELSREEQKRKKLDDVSKFLAGGS